MTTITINGQQVEAARIDDLAQTILQSRDHLVPAMLDGQTVRLSVAQILSLLEAGDLPFDLDALIAAIDGKLPRAGGTMTGLLTLAPSDDDPDGTASLNIPAGADTPDVQADGDLWADSNENLRYRRGGEDAAVYDTVNLPRPEAGEMAAGTETEPRALSAADVRAGVQSFWTELAPVPTTSGTAIDWTNIPAGVTDIELWFNEVSTNGTSHILIQIGSGGLPTTTGYKSNSAAPTSSANVTSTEGFIVYNTSASSVYAGCVWLKRVLNNNWVATHVFGDTYHANSRLGGGAVVLGGALDNIRLRTTTGTPTFDLGSVQVRYR